MQQRQCLILQGEQDWLQAQTQRLHAAVDVPRLWISDMAQRPDDALGVKQARQQLGREFSLVVFDATSAFDADAFGAVLGVLRAGGLLIVWLPPTLPFSRWLQRFLDIVRDDTTHRIQHVRQPEPLPQITLPQPHAGHADAGPTDEQREAIKAVIRVVEGHRRRPLVLTSDRGRGKSALLGMAAAQLLRAGRRRIVVTAPGLSAVDTLMEHALSELPDSRRVRNGIQWGQGEIVFVAPDALLSDTTLLAELLIIDEAAAIPLQLLERLLARFPRIVFSTTEHGYEGTGRGFALRFRHTLDRLAPGWRSQALHDPVRWRRDDALEAFSFRALLLDAEPAAETDIAEIRAADCVFALVDRDRLLADERMLRELFGLMVLAHYRTRPSDLQMMLDRDDIDVAIMQHNGHVVATAWLVREPAMPAALARAVYNGERRLKGRLLPQSLLVHAGMTDAGTLNYQRILRIAVHPALQGRGIGSHLLASVCSQAPRDIDLVGTSFALHDTLLDFWSDNGFLPVRVGQHHDQATGSHALMMLRGLSQAGTAMMQQAWQRFSERWPLELGRGLKSLPPRQVEAVTARVSRTQAVSGPDMNEVEAFARHQRPFESSGLSLWLWLQPRLHGGAFAVLDECARTLLLRIVIQQHDVADVVRETALAGRADLLERLRAAVRTMLDYEAALTR